MERSDESRTRRGMSKGENIVKWIKWQRIERMEGDRLSKKKWKGREEGEDPGKDGKRK